jgi:hypothetical protein
MSRLLMGSVLLLGSAFALSSTGLHSIGLALAIAVAVNTGFLLAFPSARA